jgi:hypothetical protein
MGHATTLLESGGTRTGRQSGSSCMLKLALSFPSSLLVILERIIARSGRNREGVKPWGAAVKKQSTRRWLAS